MTEVPFVALPAITQEQLRAYAQASGDHNPIHLDEAVARKAGLPGVIAHGMLTAAFIGERALRYAQDEARLVNGRVVRMQTRFRAMTLLGDVVSVGGTLKESSQERLVLELSAHNQRGEVTTTGTVEIKGHGVVFSPK
jgi:acyl dehydratase